jgi:hypothetical protein
MRARARGRRRGRALGIAMVAGSAASAGRAGIAGLSGAVLLSSLAALAALPALPARGAEPPRPKLQGTWMLNQDLTARLSKDRQAQQGGPGGGEGSVDRRRSGLGSMGPIGGGEDHAAPGITDWSPARERHEAEARREVVASLDSLTIAQQPGQVTITDQAGHARVLKTDGSKLRDQGAAGPAQLRARWDQDGSLVVEVKPDKGTRRTESYVVSNDGKHLYLTVTIAGQAGEILRAYDPAPAPPTPPAPPAPAAPPAPTAPPAPAAPPGS